MLLFKILNMTVCIGGQWLVQIWKYVVEVEEKIVNVEKSVVADREGREGLGGWWVLSYNCQPQYFTPHKTLPSIII